MKFFAVIGNPPYNESQGIGEQKNFAKPVYHTFIDAAYQVSDKVELIHPARFLYNAGATPKEWNSKMLDDPHLKLLMYESDSRLLFGPNVTISGGVVVSYHDTNKSFGAIKVFTPFTELNHIVSKVINTVGYHSLEDIIYIQTRLNLEGLYEDYPESKMRIGSNGKDNRLERNIFEKLSCFTEQKAEATDIKILGMCERKRAWKYIQRKYIDLSHDNLFKWKVIVSTSNGGAGNLGNEAVMICGEPFISGPNEGYTRTFLGIGAFPNRKDAENCAMYIKTKFCRCMLGVLKATQLMNKEVWHMIPLQDFTSSSDIDWSVPIPAIDQQLYKKYGLSQEEIDFIETHVKEMS